MSPSPLEEAREDPVVLHDELVEIFAEDRPNPGAAEEAARTVLENRGNAIYTDLIWNLTNLRYDNEEAKKQWREVLTHKYLISERVGRNVGVRVAAMDYFSNILGKLARPRVVDPEILERLYKDATVDPLTSLANRRHYRDRFAGEMVRARRYGSPFVIAIFDIDNFKMVNDTHGHSVGDTVLKCVAEVITASIRLSDVAARWGGEEFILLMPHTPKRGGLAVAERIRSKVVSDIPSPAVTVSGGLAAFPGDGSDELTLFQFADRALYRAKSEGKNQICASPHERRAFPRLDETLPVRIAPITAVPGMPQEKIDTKTKNISGAGIAFFHEQAVPVSTALEGEIDLPGRTAKFYGRVARIEEIEAGKYELGIQFLKIDPAVRDLILSYTE